MGLAPSLEGPFCACKLDFNPGWGSRKFWSDSNCCALKWLGREVIGGRVEESKGRFLQKMIIFDSMYILIELTV